jgi:hypothetical protein
MKFCKNLQRVVDISDPEWAPYWTNYKMLKVGSLSTLFVLHPNESSSAAIEDPVNLDESKLSYGFSFFGLRIRVLSYSD